MFSQTTAEFFLRATKKDSSWNFVFKGFSVDALLKVALDCDDIKTKILKEVIGDDRHDKLSKMIEGTTVN